MNEAPDPDEPRTHAPPTREPVVVAPPPPMLEPFGRYQLLRELGKGGMGTVYLAKDAQLDRLVALKVPRPDGDPDQPRQFLREARAAAALEHPNICPVYDVGQIDGRCFLTMAYLEGESLAAKLSDGPLSIAEAVSIVGKLAGALEEAHQRGIIHRDLKPANILLNAKGQPVITDFGLAKRLLTSAQASSTNLTEEGTICGTPAYMAPEQVNGQIQLIGPATDVYALGVILYELLTGLPPFVGPIGAVFAQTTTAAPEPPSRRRPGLDQRLDIVCLKALDKIPENRFPTMAAFAAALAATTGHRVSPGSPPAIPVSRPNWPVGLSAGLIVFVVVVTVIGILLWPPWRHSTEVDIHNPGPVIPAPTVRDPVAANEHADEGWRQNDAGDVDAAIRACNLALKLDDRCVKALICRANVHIKKKEYVPALADLDRATAIEPDNHMPHVDRAWINNAKGDHQRAFADADRAVLLNSESGEAYYQRGAARLGQGMHRDAVDDFTTAIRLEPDFVWAYRERAKAYQELGEAALADKDLAKAARIDNKAKE